MATGKWREAGVPHKGWVCAGVEDLEDERMICEMCEVVEIRFVHTMQHPEYPATLACGCICAGNMEQDLEAARGREKRAHSHVMRRAKWLTRKGWYRTLRIELYPDGRWYTDEWYLNVDGYRIDVYPRYTGGPWGFSITHRATDLVVKARKEYPDKDTARRMTLDALFWLKDRVKAGGVR
jgi:hypothetical protein